MDTLHKLFEVSRRMAETRALEPLLEYIMDTALETFDGENGYLILYDQNNQLDFRLARDNQGEIIHNPDSQISHSILRDVLESGKPILTANAIKDPNYHASKSVGNLQLASVIVVPLISRGNLLGALYLENRTKPALFTLLDVEPLQFFASQAAVSIENAMLNDELEERVQRRTKELAFAHELLQQEVLEQERAQIISNFIESASHHFRTPLTVINTNADLLRRRVNINGFDYYIEGIFDQTAAILELVDSLVVMAQLDSIDEFPLETYNQGEILQETQIITLQRTTRQNRAITFHYPAEILLARTNHFYLRQAIIELIDNAIQSTTQNGEIEIRLYREGDTIIYSVTDDGIGMDEEIIPKVFDRFYRVDRAGTSRGFGLGLAIVQSIMDLHNGEINVTSAPGRGSTFKLILPA